MPPTLVDVDGSFRPAGVVPTLTDAGWTI